MVGRIRLIFWRWVVTFHDQLHDARDKTVMEEFEWSGNVLRDSDNITYTSPSVHYQGVNRRKDD